MFENPTRGREAKNFTTNVPQILDLKSSFEQIFSENLRWVPLFKMSSFIWIYYSDVFKPLRKAFEREW